MVGVGRDLCGSSSPTLAVVSLAQAQAYHGPEHEKKMS